MPLALYTFGQFIEPADNPSNDGFHELNDPVFEVVDKAPGLIARSGYASDEGPSPWGEEVYPRFYNERGDGWSPATLSLWRDIESLYVFTYSGLHAKALKHGREWFQSPKWPPLVLWWHERRDNPQWCEGVERLEYLHDHGPSSFAFTFKIPFDQFGQPFDIDRARVKELKSKNAIF
ncbi:DUF3291 domain-containing protein [Cohaesibacter gelatinilyticus]|uniref:DUF3291 domain-containing protein n=1 Tax=Cohaesibacter gelatinilyticus TaxID=372072 RepID=A0A285ND91_9HYPH|nr:DUF3291 domain-containing protein [Cohaesibacter gelatinilyticus]SNZ07399.1 protein of unknown function [Cohaesibacter gelatinilyticus]